MTKKINVLFIGRGTISAELASHLPKNCSLYVFSIREIKLSNENYETLSIIKKSDVIVYLGYHHRNLYVNLHTLYKILNYLSFSKWSGLFIFFNTQAALDANCHKKIIQIPGFFNYDLYQITKRIQSKILKIFDSKISIAELYLPIVMGVGTRIENKFEKIALHKEIYMINSGANKVILLDLVNFSSWLWESSVNFVLNQTSNLSRKIFIFDAIKTEDQLIKEFRDKNNLPSIDIKSYKLNYWFSNSVFSNLVWMIKKSPFGLILYLMVGLIKKNQSPVIIDTNLPNLESSKYSYEIFVPNEIECMSSATEILMDKINFKKINIKDG
jgi:hypothetical protein